MMARFGLDHPVEFLPSDIEGRAEFLAVFLFQFRLGQA